MLSEEGDVDPDTGEESASPRDAAIITGSLALVIGVPLLTMAIVNSVRLADREEYLDEEVEQVSRRSVPCEKGERLANARVIGMVRNRRLNLGRTGDDGRLEIDLDEAISSKLMEREPPSEIGILVRGREAGTLDISPYVEKQTELAWQDALEDGTAEALEEFAERYPDSKRKTEATDRAWQLHLESLIDESDRAREAGNDRVALAKLERCEELDPDNADVRALRRRMRPVLRRVEVEKILSEARSELGRIARAKQKISIWKRVNSPDARRQIGRLKADIARNCEKLEPIMNRARRLAGADPPDSLESLEKRSRAACSRR